MSVRASTDAEATAMGAGRDVLGRLHGLEVTAARLGGLSSSAS